jgi:hypothetical protein
MEDPKQSRRMFLKGPGAAVMAIPFLPSLLTTRTSRAQTLSRQRRLIMITSDHAIDRESLSPLPANHNPLTPVIRLDDVTSRQSLTEMWKANGGKLTPAMSGPAWEPLLPYMNIIAGTALASATHGHNATTASCFSGCTDGGAPFVPWSVDYVAEKKLARPTHAFPSLRTSLFYNHGRGYFHLAYRDWCYGGKKLTPMYDVAELESAISKVPTSTKPNTTPDPRIAQRAKLIDMVKGQYDRLLRNPRLSTMDRDRLEDAVDLWNDATNRGKASFACGATPPSYSGVNWRTHHEYAMDLLAYALACDMTPVVAYNLPHGTDSWPSSRVEHGGMHPCQHGNAKENPGAWTQYQVMKSWRLARVAHFANRLRTLTDTSGASLLDNSLLYWGQEYSQQGQLHRMTGFISLFFGGAGGRLSTGNFVDCYGEPSEASGESKTYNASVPHNRVGVTILRAMGLTTEDIESVTGRVGFGEYAGSTVAQEEVGGSSPFKIKLSTAGKGRFSSDAEKRKALPILREVA